MISKRAGRISVHGVAIGVMALLFSLPPRAAADDGECRGSHGRAAVADALAAAEAQCNCGGAQSNGDFVSCVAEVARQRANAHQLPNQCRGRVQECAAQSTCGRPGAVTCCRTDSSGVSHCSIKSDASECDAPDGGSVCTSTFPSCCTACTWFSSVWQSSLRETGTRTTTTTTAATTGAPPRRITSRESVLDLDFSMLASTASRRWPMAATMGTDRATTATDRAAIRATAAPSAGWSPRTNARARAASTWVAARANPTRVQLPPPRRRS